MGTMTFQLPAGLPADASRELQRTCMAGGPDNMPWPTDKRFANGQMIVTRPVDESGYLVAPWGVEGAGRVMGTSATLIERPRPYNLLVELARGKLNQVRGQAADWQAGGLSLPAEVGEHLRAAGHAFGEAVTGPAEEAGDRAANALRLAYAAADRLVDIYVQQVFQIRHQRQAQLDTTLGCRVALPPPAPLADEAKAAFNSLTVPLAWASVESEEAAYHWEAADALVTWAQRQEVPLSAGPLIDFSSSQLPAWLWLWERDVPSLAAFMGRYVEAAVRRYRQRIRRWQVTAATNCASCLSLSEDDLLQLTYRLGEAARQADSGIELVVGIAQPWGEYMAQSERTHSPFIFADTLIRSGLNVAALDLEIIMGVEPRGSYCRDRLELSRLLDLYALLGVPLRVTLGYPAAEEADLDADPELRVGAGRWQARAGEAGFSPTVQAEWAAAVTALCACKPCVQSVQWAHLSDAVPHQFPRCGLADVSAASRPALQKLHAIRAQHLR